jgi:hypothetical protein
MDGLMSPPTGAVGLPPTEFDETAGTAAAMNLLSLARA